MVALTNTRASAFAADHVKICLTSSLITLQNIVVVSYTVFTHEEGPKNFQDAGAHPFLCQQCVNISSIGNIWPGPLGRVCG